MTKKIYWVANQLSLAKEASMKTFKKIDALILTTLLALCFGNAQAAEMILTAPAKKNVGGDLAVFYARSTASNEDSYFNESYGAALGLGWTPTAYTAFRLSGSLTREIGESDERFRASNTDLSMGFPTLEPIRDLKFQTSVSATFPTNQDDRQYLTYQGSLGASGSVVKSFTSLSSFLNRLTLIGSGNVSRNFFEYDASREGTLNRFMAATLGVSAGYSIIKYLGVGAGVANTRSWASNGGRGSDRYRLNYNMVYKSEPNFSFRLEYVTTDRTFNYDYRSNNIALYDSEISSVVGTLKYDI